MTVVPLRLSGLSGYPVLLWVVTTANIIWSVVAIMVYTPGSSSPVLLGVSAPWPGRKGDSLK